MKNREEFERPRIEKSIDVAVPVSVAYNQWTQFEEFPLFMEGVKEVRQLDDKHLFWRAEIAGKEVHWDAEITHQEPDKSIGWRSTSPHRPARVPAPTRLKDPTAGLRELQTLLDEGRISQAEYAERRNAIIDAI